MKKSTCSHQAGFTMVELAVTLAILGIIAAVAIPSIINWRQSFVLKEASQGVYATLMRAKTEAMRRNHRIAVSFLANGGANNTPVMQICVQTCIPQNIITQFSLPDGVTFDPNAAGSNCLTQLAGANAANAGLNAISFRPNSLPLGGVGNCGSVYLATSKRQASVQISNVGNIAIF